MDGPKYQELENQTYFQETSYAKLSTNLLHSIAGNGAPFPPNIVSVCICNDILIHIIKFSTFLFLLFTGDHNLD